MVRPNRIKDYFFVAGSTDQGNLVADANGNIGTYSNFSINGAIQKITFLGGNYTRTGSVQIVISGTNELIFNLISGTATGHVGSQTIVYPMLYSVDSSLGTGSPQAFTQRVINAPLLVNGSGLGASKSGLGIFVHYI